MIQGNNFNEFFENTVKKYGELTCLTDEETGKKFTFEELNFRVNRAVNLLKKLNIEKGERFATVMKNTPEFFVMYLASMKLGTLIVPMPVDSPSNKIKDSFNNLSISLAIVDEENNKKVEEIRDDLKYLKNIFTVDGKDNLLNDVLSEMSTDVNGIDFPSISTQGSLYFSSGTTGTPKGIAQSPKNLLTAAKSLAYAYGFSFKDTQMGILPNYHTALATYGFWPGFCVGSNFVLFRKFSKNNFWKNIEKYKIVFVETVPTILIMLMNPPENISKYDISSLKFIGSGSATLLPEVQKKFEEIFGVLICNKYGLSETEPTHFNPPQRELRKEGSIGKPLPMCEVKVMKEDGSFCKENEIGEIVMRGDNVVDGYYNDSDATSQAFINGWFHSGDLGYFDKDGFYFLVSRKKDIVNRGGAKIYPNEVDKILFSHPDVVEAAAFGVSDETYGEEIIACVTLKKDSKIKDIDLIQHCQTYLEKYKCPKKIIFINKMPKTPSGKLLRRKLAEMMVKKRLK